MRWVRGSQSREVPPLRNWRHQGVGIREDLLERLDKRPLLLPLTSDPDPFDLLL